MVPFDAADVHARLDAITAKVEECRAAIQVAEEGDPTALEPMRATVDAMAEDLAILRSAVGGQDLA
jgi:hypothetical protein